jgi:hypothetical protein
VSDRDRLIEAFEMGALVRPSPDHMAFIDVIRGVAHACGVTVPLNDHVRSIAAHLVGADHIILLLADGLGIESVDAMPRGSWIRQHTLRAIHAPFPSTTTSAVTSIATAQYPSTHAVTGWWVHVPSLQAPATVFAHDRATDGVSLDRLGVTVRDLCPAEPMLPLMTRNAALVLPADIIESPFTCYMAGTAERIGYGRLTEAAQIIARRIMDADGPTFTYWYTSSPDREAHEHGAAGAASRDASDRLDRVLERLSGELAELGRTYRIIGTADHGHLQMQPHLELEEDDSLLEDLTAPPAGDMRVQFWHVRRGRESSFVTGFRQRFGRWFVLLTAAEFEELGLLGADAWSAPTRDRVGQYVSISLGAATLRFAGLRGQAGYRRMRSGHSGLSPAEMLVPLIIAGEAPAPAFDA